MKRTGRSGPELGQSVSQLVENLHNGHGLALGKPSPTMAQLEETVDHIKATTDEWRSAALYLAAQLHTARWHGDAHVTREAMWALSNTWRALAKFEEAVPAAGKHLETWSRERIAARFDDVQEPALFPEIGDES